MDLRDRFMAEKGREGMKREGREKKENLRGLE